MEHETLIRRDLPIAPGRKLRYQFTIEVEIETGEDGDGDITLEELEAALGGMYPNADTIWDALRRNYGLAVMDHAVYLIDVGGEDGEIRFERLWEKNGREGEHHEFWKRSKTWLDEIPPVDPKLQAAPDA